MARINKKIEKISSYLQSLAQPEYCKKVEEAIEKKDRTSLIQICKNAKIPNQYLASVVSVLFSMATPEQKYPEFV
jgi:hypothetical protein